MDALTLDHIRKCYGPNTILNNLTYSFPLKEVSVILGKSGCGKTTLLRLIMGLEKAEGKITMPPALRLGMMFQEARLMPFLTLRDNITLGKKTLTEEELSQLLELVHLKEAASRYPHELSGGMQQRASLARTLAQDNDFILMDEPFAALDYFTRRHIQEELLAMRKKCPFGVLLVTHNVDEALRLGDRILILEGGKFILEKVLPQEAALRDLLSAPYIAIKRQILEALEI